MNKATMPFGKYKGREIVALPVSYVRFILRTTVYRDKLSTVELKAACGVITKVRIEKNMARLGRRAAEKKAKAVEKERQRYYKETGFLKPLLK